MHFWVILLALTSLSMIFPSFPKILNWGFLFPFVAVMFGTLVFVGANFFIFDNKHFSVAAWLASVGFCGVPFSLWLTREANG